MTDEDTSTTDPTAARRRPREVVLGAGVIALLIVALAVALVMTSIRLHDDDKNASRLRQAEAVDAARVSSLAAARTYAVDLTSYNYKTLTAGFAAVANHSSPSFRASFEKSSAALVPVLKKYDAVSKGIVVAAGLASCTTVKAQAVILLDQTVTNTADKKGPTTDESRVAMTLVVDHGHWVIDQVKLLG